MSEDKKENLKVDLTEKAAIYFEEKIHLKKVKMMLDNMSSKEKDRVFIQLLFAPTDVYAPSEESKILRLSKPGENLLNYCNEILQDKNRIAKYTQERKNGGSDE